MRIFQNFVYNPLVNTIFISKVNTLYDETIDYMVVTVSTPVLVLIVCVLARLEITLLIFQMLMS